HSQFEHRLRGKVEGVVRIRVEQAAAQARRTQELVGGRAAAGKNLIVFQRTAEPEFVVEVLGNTKAVLAVPDEACSVLRMDGLRQDLGAVVQTVRGFGCERPHLAAADVQVVRSGTEGSARPKLPLANDVTIRLVVVRSNAGAEPV